MAIQISTEQLKNTAVTSAKIDLTGTFDYSSGTLRSASPSGNNDVANKQYVDNIAAGLHFKDSVQVATTTGITLSGEQTIDGVTTSSSRILVKDQTDAAENGIYVTASGSWTRATDMDEGDEFPAAAFFVREGTANADLGFVCTNDTAPTLGTDNVEFTQFTGAANITAGEALTKSGNTLDVNVDDSSIEVVSDALQIKALGVTNAMLAGSIANAKLANSTISGVNLGSNLNSLSAGNGLSMTSYNGSAAVSDLTIDLDGATLSVGADGIKIADAGVDTTQLADDAVTAAKVADGAINASSMIADGVIVNAKIADSTIAAAKLAGSIPSDKLNLGNGVQDNAGNLQIDLDGSTLALGVNGIKISDGGVDTTQLADDAVTAAKVADGAINASSMIADGVVVNAKIADSTIANAKLANSTISGVALGSNLNSLSAGNGLSMTSFNGSAAVSDLTVDLDGSSLSVGADGLKVADGGIASSMLSQTGGSEAVTTQAIRNNAVVTDKINDSAVTTAKINDSAVTSAKVSFVPSYENYSGDGSATTFDLDSAIDSNFAGGVVAYRNGLAMTLVQSNPSGQDQYTISETGGSGGVGQIIFGSAPNNGDTIGVLYWS